jgi:thymidylate synthase
MQPKEIIFTCGDTHVYKNHIEPISEQLNRSQRPLPVLLLDNSIKDKDFSQISIDDFELCGYYPHPPIKLSMAV